MAFIEPLGHNPIINLYRRRTPALRTPDEHPLRIREIKEIERAFGSLQVDYVHLFTLAANPFRGRPGFDRALTILEGVDRRVLGRVRPLRRHAWMVVLSGAK